MRVITCASFYGTGSSAVTDFFSEFDNISFRNDNEYRFLQDPDGVSDLEFHVVENNNRHNTSDAIKHFLRYMKLLQKVGYGGYDIFGDAFWPLTEQFVSDITELKTHTWWNQDRLEKGKLFATVDRAYSLAKRVTTGNLHSERKFSLLQNREVGYYTAIGEAAFLAAVRRYVSGLMAAANPEGKPFIMMDQMVPPTNVNRYTRYFDDVRAVVVDRDPRDVYMLEKTVWQWGIIPVADVREYVRWFEITRRQADPALDDPKTVLRIRFEDMIHRYDETAAQLMQFVGVDPAHHVRPRTKFDPAVSVKNTGLYKNAGALSGDIAYIEEHLGTYLYRA